MGNKNHFRRSLQCCVGQRALECSPCRGAAWKGGACSSTQRFALSLLTLSLSALGSGPVQLLFPLPESYATHFSASLLGCLLLPDAFPDHPTRLSAPLLRPASSYLLYFLPSTYYCLTNPVFHLFCCSISTIPCPDTH